jgi:predicted O-methyltransferase YrrM
MWKSRIDINEVNNIILNKDDVNPEDVSEYLGEASVEHYKLLAWLSTQFNNVEIFDIGTHKGASSSALSYNSSNRVLSFDINLSKLSKRKPNCEYFEQNLWDPEVLKLWKDRILESPLIFLDIDPHEGIMEYDFYTWLKNNNYKGILVLDDIWYFKNMRDNLWSKIWGTGQELE